MKADAQWPNEDDANSLLAQLGLTYRDATVMMGLLSDMKTPGLVLLVDAGRYVRPGFVPETHRGWPVETRTRHPAIAGGDHAR